MLTPQIIATRRFDKAMGGYKQDEVEAFLQQVAAEYSQLQSEKEELEEKIEVLAEQVEKYREDEDSLRSALIGAQKLGDSVIRESKNKADYIIRDARDKANQILESAQKNIEREQFALLKMQKEVTKFKNRLLTIYRQHLDIISALPEYDDEGMKKEDIHTETQENKEEIPESQPQAQAEPEAPAMVSQLSEESSSIDFGASLRDRDSSDQDTRFMPASPSEPPAVAQLHQPIHQQGESRFGALKFGEGYDVDRDTDNKNTGLFSRKKHK